MKKLQVTLNVILTKVIKYNWPSLFNQLQISSKPAHINWDGIIVVSCKAVSDCYSNAAVVLSGVSCCNVNKITEGISLCEGIIVFLISWVTATLPHPLADKWGLLQPALCVCVVGNSCPWGRATAEDEGGIRRDSCRHSITTHDTTGRLKTTQRAFPHCLPSFTFHYALTPVNMSENLHIILTHFYCMWNPSVLNTSVQLAQPTRGWEKKMLFV